MIQYLLNTMKVSISKETVIDATEDFFVEEDDVKQGEESPKTNKREREYFQRESHELQHRNVVMSSRNFMEKEEDEKGKRKGEKEQSGG